MTDRCRASVPDGYLGSVLCDREKDHSGLHYDANLGIYWARTKPLAASKQKGETDG